MTNPASTYSDGSLASAAELPSPRRRRFARCLRICFRSGEWHLSEDVTGCIGGIFTSLSAAVAFARNELRGVPRSGVVVDLDGASFDGQP
jgi:hypothetical protein